MSEIEIEIEKEKEISKYVKQCLTDYPANLSRLEALKNNLHNLRVRGDVKVQDYKENHKSAPKTAHTDPVFNHVTRIEALEKEIETLKRNTEPLTKMINDLKSPYALDSSLNADMIKILGFYYFGRNSVAAILEVTGWSRAGFFRKKNKLTELARSYLGY